MRWAPLAAFALFAAVAAAWLARDPALKRRSYPPGSSLNEGPQGASLAREYLERIGARPGALTVPLPQAALPASTVLLRLDVKTVRDGPPAALPEKLDSARDGGTAARPSPPPPALSAAEEAFARSGGRLVLAMEGEPASGEPRKVSLLLPGVRAVRPLVPRGLPKAALVDAQPIFEHGEAPSIVRVPLGAGEVFWLAQPELLLNARLGEADHLALLLALCAGRRPLFDEAVHGIVADSGALDLLRRWGLGPSLLLAALAALALFWRRAVIAGPPADPWRDARSESVELVDSMAALYQEALTPEEALQLYRTRVVHEIALTLAVPEPRAASVLDAHAPGLAAATSFRERLLLLASACERFRDEHRRSR